MSNKIYFNYEDYYNSEKSHEDSDSELEDSSSSDSDDSSSVDSLSSDEDNYNSENLSKTDIVEKIKYLQRLLNIEKVKPKKYCVYMENNIKLNASCCSNVFCCSQCHNIEKDHKLDIKYTTIICCECEIEQKYSDYCIACQKKLKTNYICKKCYIFDDSVKYKHHCDKCNTCHVEEKDNLDHCDKCNICYFKKTKHLCINLDNNCPICLEQLKTDVVINLVCGHVIHNECYNLLIKNSYKCPLCFKTIANMKKSFEKLDEEIEQSRLLDNSINIKTIYCNDCEKKSDSIFNYIGTKCNLCGSYNTRLE